MPSIEVNGVNIAYEVAGEGTPIVWTPGAYVGRIPETYVFAGRFSADYKVLIWDRPNCGASDFIIAETPSEWHLWIDCLHELLHRLDMTPAYFGGGSAGSELSLLMAHKYPGDVKGLILYCPSTNNVEDVLGPMAKARHYSLARTVENEGMSAVVKSSREPPDPDWAWLSAWVTDLISQNPENQDRILSTDSKGKGKNRSV